MKDGIYAAIHTQKGIITIQLHYKETPATVGNFVGLAEGTLPNEVKANGTPYYDGLNFHRVIPDFMIQGGCPQGSGVGGPGYQFDDEINPNLRHDKPGILSMANAAERMEVNFYHTCTTHGDGKHTVFGAVMEGQSIVDAVAQEDSIDKIEIKRVGKDAEDWDAVAAFQQLNELAQKRIEEQKEKQAKELEKISKGFSQTESGLRYKIIQEGAGEQASAGKKVSVHYKGELLDGTVFDSSYKRQQPIDFVLGQGQVIPGWDEGVSLLKVGDKARFLIPSDLAYGSRGAGGVIPPDAALSFDVELIAVS